ncbi:MAG TPA: hypothetical protein VNH15_07100 [Elusimicrobiota bacterium]|nr:hypothetical protein [Elusimicrobiota bacterium]
MRVNNGASCRKPLAALALALLAAGCGGKGPFLYKPNKPLWPGHDAQAPLFAATAAVSPLRDMTQPADGATDLARAGAGAWPELSPEALSRALAAEFSADGLLASAKVLDDPEHDDATAALAAGARLYVTGSVDEASVDAGASEGGTLSLALDLQVFARQAGSGAFDWRVIDGTYRAAVPMGSGGGAAAENAALNKIFAEAAIDAALALQDPQVQAKLGWTAP